MPLPKNRLNFERATYAESSTARILLQMLLTARRNGWGAIAEQIAKLWRRWKSRGF